MKTDLSYTDAVDYDYERTACTCNDWPCRCTRIYDQHITHININKVMTDILHKHFKGNIKISEFDLYCFDRICRLNKIWDQYEYTVEVCDGYYGEEINGVYFDNESVVISQFEQVLGMDNDLQKLKYILELEYGYVIGSVQNATSISVLECSPSMVITAQDTYYHKLEKDIIDSYRDYNLPCAVCKKREDYYIVIDGYHRVAAAQNKENIDIILIE